MTAREEQLSNERISVCFQDQRRDGLLVAHGGIRVVLRVLQKYKD